MQVGSTGSSRLMSGVQGNTNALKRTNQALRKILEKLSTAQRINRASDDAAGLSISEQLRSNIRGYKMASRNIEDAMSVLNISDGTANELGDMLQRQRELAIAAKNDTLNDRDRRSLNTEYQQLTSEIQRISQSTQFNGQQTANGTDLGSGTAIIQAGAGAQDQIPLPQVDFNAIATSLSGTTITSSIDATNAMVSLDAAIKSLNDQRSTVGATINAFTSASNNLSVSMVNTQAAESVLRDQDMAEGIAELTRQQLLNEGGMAAFKRFNEVSRYQIMGILES